MKKVLILILLIFCVIVFGEPYRPYPIIFVHGYNTNNLNGGAFGLKQKSQKNGYSEIEHLIYTKIPASLLNPLNNDIYYISRNEAEEIIVNETQPDNLSHYCLNLNKDVLNYWNEIQNNNIYWLENKENNYIPSFNEIINKEKEPKNIFLETIEFDFPGIGSADEKWGDDIEPYVYQVGRGRELLCKLKETLINYYTKGEPVWTTKNGRYYDVEIRLGNETRELRKEDLKGDSKVIFVAHSFGGVNLRQMLIEIHNDGDDWLYNHIEKIITVNTPHLGSPFADHHDELIENSGWWFRENHFYWTAGLLYTIADFPIQYFFKINTDAGYDLQPFGSGNIDSHFINVINTPENVRNIQDKVPFSLYSSIVGYDGSFQSAMYGLLAVSIGVDLYTAFHLSTVGVVLATIDICLKIASFIAFEIWTYDSDFIVNVNSQKPLDKFNELGIPIEESYTNHGRMHDTDLNWMGVEACYDDYEELLKMIDNNITCKFDSFSIISSDGVRKIIKIDSVNTDTSGTFFLITEPKEIYGTINKYFISKGKNKIEFPDRDMYFNYKTTNYNNKEINFGNINGSTFVLKGNNGGDLSDLFYRGKNVITVRASNLIGNTDKDSIVIKIASPKFLTLSPKDNSILNFISSKLTVIREIDFSNFVVLGDYIDTTDKSIIIDSIVNKIRLIKPIPPYEAEYETVYSMVATPLSDFKGTDFLYLHSITEGEYEITSKMYNNGSNIATLEQNVFYVDTTKPELSLSQSNDCGKYSFRNQGFAKIVCFASDNFTYFFKFADSMSVLFCDSNNNIVDSINFSNIPFGTVQYAKWELEDTSAWHNYPDGLYNAKVYVMDKAKNITEDSISFIIDNTPPEIEKYDSTYADTFVSFNNDIMAFDDSLLNSNDLGKDLYFSVNEKSKVKLIFTDLNSSLSLSNTANADTIVYSYFYNDSTGDIDSTETKINWINGGMFGSGLSLPDGYYKVELYAFDEVDNDTTISLYDNFRVDRTSPIILNPVCLPFVVNDNDSTTLYFTASELNDKKENRGIVEYSIILNDSIIKTFSLNCADFEDSVIEVEVDLSNASNGINNIEIIAEDNTKEWASDSTGNKSYAYAQVIKKTIGTYISNPNDNDTLYYNIANVIEGIANDPDMSNLYPFEKYALYWKSGSISEIPKIREDLNNWETVGMLTPISIRGNSENEAVNFIEYVSKLGVFIPQTTGNITLCLASFENEKDTISAFLRNVYITDNYDIKQPDLTELFVGYEKWQNNDTFLIDTTTRDTMYINYNLQNKISDIMLEIIDNNGEKIYTKENKNIIPILSNNIVEPDSAGIYIYKYNGRYMVHFFTPGDTTAKILTITSINNAPLTIFSTEGGIDTLSPYSKQIITYSEDYTISFVCSDTLINISSNPINYNVYCGENKALVNNEFTLNTSYTFKWNLKDIFERNVATGDYSVILTAYGSDGIGADTIMKTVFVENPLNVYVNIYPETINVINPLNNTLSIEVQSNQSGYVKYIIEKERDTIITDYKELNYLFYDNFQTSDFDLNDSIIYVTVITTNYNQSIADTFLDTILVENVDVDVLGDGLFIPEEFRTANDTIKEIYDGKGIFNYILDNADGEIFFSIPYDYSIETYSARLFNSSLRIWSKVVYDESIDTFISGDEDFTATTVSTGMNVDEDTMEVLDGILNFYIYAPMYAPQNNNNLIDYVSNDSIPYYAEFIGSKDYMTLRRKGGYSVTFCEDINMDNKYYIILNKPDGSSDTLEEEQIFDDSLGSGHIYGVWIEKIIHSANNIEETQIFSGTLGNNGIFTSSIAPEERTDTIYNSIDPTATYQDYFYIDVDFADYHFEDTIYFEGEANINKEILIFPIDTSNEHDLDFYSPSAPESLFLYLKTFNDSGQKALAYYYRVSPNYFPYYKKQQFNDTLLYNPTTSRYETDTLGTIDSIMNLPDANLISYDCTNDTYLTGGFISVSPSLDSVVARDNEDAIIGVDENDTLNLTSEIYIATTNGIDWNFDSIPEAENGRVYSSWVEFASNSGFPITGIDSFRLIDYYPSDPSVLNEWSMFVIDSSTGLTSNPLLIVNNMDYNIKNPDLTENMDLLVENTFNNDSSTVGGYVNANMLIKHRLRAKPSRFLPIRGNLLSDITAPQLRRNYTYNVFIKTEDSIFNVFDNNKPIPSIGSEICYLNTEDIFGEIEIIVPVYKLGIQEEGIFDPIGIEEELYKVYTKNIIIGDEIQYYDTSADSGDSILAQTSTPYKRGYMSYLMDSGDTDIVKLNFHIAPEMIVESGEEPFIGESFCPIINIHSMNNKVNKPVVNYYLTAEEVGEIDKENLKFYGISSNGNILQFATVYIKIKNNANITEGYKFTINASAYDGSFSFDSIAYVTLLDSSVTDTTPFDEVYVSAMTDSGIVLTFKCENIVQRILDQGIGVIITDPIDNIYTALRLLHIKEEMKKNNNNNLFDNITNNYNEALADSCELALFYGVNDTSSTDLIELTDNMARIKIPADSVFEGYNHLFVGNYDALERGFQVLLNDEENYYNLGLNLSGDSIYLYKNSTITELSFTYCVPRVLEMDTNIIIDNYTGKEIRIILTDSTNALIQISNANGENIYSTSISSMTNDTSFFWNGNLRIGESDNGEYYFTVIPFSASGILGEAQNGKIMINRHPEVSIDLPDLSERKWFNNIINLSGTNDYNPENMMNWFTLILNSEVDVGNSKSKDTIKMNTTEYFDYENIPLILEGEDRYTNKGRDTIYINIDNTKPEFEYSIDNYYYDYNDTLTLFNTNRISLTLSDNLSGIMKAYKIIENDTTLVRFYQDGDYYVLLNKDTINTVQVLVYDSATNYNNKFVKFIDDYEAPEISLNIGEPSEFVDGVYFVTTETPISIEVLDNYVPLSQCKFKWGIFGEWIEFENDTLIYKETINQAFDSLYIYAKDTLDNDTLKVYAFGFDNTAPITTIEYTAPEFYNGSIEYVNNGSSIILRATDNISGIKGIYYELDLEEGVEVYDSIVEINIDNFATGVHWIKYYAFDKANNSEEIHNESFYYDDIKPNTWYSILGDIYQNNDLYVSIRSEIEIIGEDKESGLKNIEILLNNQAINNNPFSLIEEGLNNIMYRGIDNVGNIEEFNNLDIYLDNTPPNLTLSIDIPIYVNGSDTFVNSNTQIMITGEDNLSGIKEVMYSVNNTSDIILNDTITLINEGANTIYIKGTDNVNNESEWRYYNLILDNTPPSINYSLNGDVFNNYITSNTQVILSAEDEYSGVKEILYSINGNTEIYTEPFVINGIDGEYSIEYWAIDNLGNESEKYVLVLNLDNTAPELNIVFNTPVYESNYQFVTSLSSIDAIAIDNGCGVKESSYNIDDLITGEFINNTNILLNILNENIYTITVNSADNLNHISSIDSVFVIDNSSPITQINIGEPQYEKGDTLLITSNTEINLTSTDYPSISPNSGVKCIYYGYGIEQTVFDNNVIDYVIGEDGIYSYSFKGEDNLGNIEEENIKIIELDNTAPEIEIISPYDGMFTNCELTIYGTISDKNFYRWRLDYRNIESTDWITITDWTEDIPQDSALGIFAGDSLSAGDYIIKLTSQDLVFNTSEDSIILRVGEPNRDLELLGYKKPQGVWADEYIYIADTHNKRIAKVNTDNELLLSIKEFEPTDVFVKDGYIYTTDHNGKVYVYKSNGIKFTTITGQRHPKGIEVKNNKIYVADTYKNRIVVYTITGDIILEINNIIHPEGIAVDNEGNIFTCIDERNIIKGFNENGEEIFEYGVTGHDAGEFIRVVDIDVDSHGLLYVLDRNNNRVEVIDWKKKAVLLVIGEVGVHHHHLDGLNKPEGLGIVEEDGIVKYLYIADTDNNRIVRYNFIERSDNRQLELAGTMADELEIEQLLPYPNPTSDISTVRIVLNKPAEIELTIYTVSGKIIYRDRITGNAGINEIQWNGENENGELVLNGVYNVKVTAVSGNETKEKWTKIARIR